MLSLHGTVTPEAAKPPSTCCFQPDSFNHAGSSQSPQAAVGVLGLHPETVQRALTDQALGLLLPPTLLLMFEPCDPSPEDPTHPTDPNGSSSLKDPELDQQLGANTPQAESQSYSSSALSSQQSNQQPSRQSSQEMSHGLDQSLTALKSGCEWRRLSGGPDGAGFGGNRGSLWAMVAPVGALTPITMKVRSLILFLTE